MFKIIWVERVLGMIRVESRAFASRDERFRFALALERNPAFVRVVEMNNA